MTAAGGRRRIWRWILAVWAVVVVGGGVLTLWLQDSAEPPPPAGWYTSEEDGREAPAPLLSADASEPCPEAEDGRPVICAVMTGPADSP
ncbi:hypothetical protein [Streptomyces sp. NPDC006446]|uniref:hypothetical protein n=1 Tax=Streptomyces sp. NPDC006446 TaxID=3154301 RepID=UPI0033A8A915